MKLFLALVVNVGDEAEVVTANIEEGRASKSREGLDDAGLWWDYPTMIVTLDAKRRLTVPVALAPASPGDAFEALYDETEDEIILRRVKRAKRSWIEVMRECPIPMDDLPARSRELPKKLKL